MIKTAFRYLNYYLRSNTLHGTHSPFVYNLLEDVVYQKKPFTDYEMIEEMRSELKKDQRRIVITDLGAGSRVNKGKERVIADIASHSLKPKKYAQLIYRLVKHFKPQHSIELGTSLGITSAYIAKANPDGRLITMEGCPNTLAIAQENFDRLQLKNISVISGNFDATFSQALDEHDKIDFVFFDGNHQKEATLHYFYQALNKIHEGSFFIFDDIYWSDGMKEAWKEIKKNERVTVTIDLFFIGLVFFRKGQAKENFSIRF